MGQIIASRLFEQNDDKVVVEALIDKDEVVQLKGHIDEVYLFSARTADLETSVSLRGKNQATKYFLIPRELRRDLQFNSDVKCQRVDADGKAIFVYVVDSFIK